jgi:hypothetical protein
MIIHTMKDRGIHAAALQETWAAVPPGRDNDEIDGFLVIRHGETVRSCNRGRLGVVIILSPIARLAWEARGELVRKDREGRVMAVDLALEGHRTLRLGSACSPATGASSDEGQAFYDGVTRCSAGGGPRVILAIGMDGSASIGVGNWADRRAPERRPGRPVEPRGLRHQIDAGRELLAHMSVQSLCSAASFFRGRRRAPWVHPRAGQPCGLGHWLVRRSGLGRVTGACVRPSLAVAVGHAPVYMAISTGRRRRPRRVGARPAGVAALRCSDARLGFARGFGAGMTG